MNSSASPRRRSLRSAGTVGAGVLAAALIAGCGSDDAGPSHHDPGAHHSASAAPASVAPGVNSADVAFAQQMIPHHRQAVEMAELVPDRTDDVWLREFAQQVIAAQQPEIDQLTAALESWSQPLPDDDADAHAHHDMDGMMTPEQMAALEQLTGPAFDDEWITMMIAHHEGAVTMAQTELADGENPEMRALAQAIIDTQQREIEDMRAQLAQ